ncbi:hypothetical protein CYMTET_33261 [Cymbomonas tetramitiformis]|uniref:Uncharacterized protein n=1 Tax=Cymbomonas tetramitiformis TaxID=36881 RepID=A0AAE0FDH0_9CHLO|nr:hypothetical protein CYMTET_33261 [Cymbomonas tetramitiformis]
MRWYVGWDGGQTRIDALEKKLQDALDLNLDKENHIEGLRQCVLVRLTPTIWQTCSLAQDKDTHITSLTADRTSRTTKADREALELQQCQAELESAQKQLAKEAAQAEALEAELAVCRKAPAEDGGELRALRKRDKDKDQVIAKLFVQKSVLEKEVERHRSQQDLESPREVLRLVEESNVLKSQVGQLEQDREQLQREVAKLRKAGAGPKAAKKKLHGEGEGLDEGEDLDRLLARDDGGVHALHLRLARIATAFDLQTGVTGVPPDLCRELSRGGRPTNAGQQEGDARSRSVKMILGLLNALEHRVEGVVPVGRDQAALSTSGRQGPVLEEGEGRHGWGGDPPGRRPEGSDRVVYQPGNVPRGVGKAPSSAGRGRPPTRQWSAKTQPQPQDGLAGGGLLPSINSAPNLGKQLVPRAQSAREPLMSNAGKMAGAGRQPISGAGPRHGTNQDGQKVFLLK